MTAPATGVCASWAALADVPEKLREGVLATDLTNGLMAASQLLFLATGRQYAGDCTDVVRPSATRPPVDYGRPIRGWAGPDGGTTDWPWGMCGCNWPNRTGCTSLPEVTLGAYPVTSITTVKVDGAVLPSSAYRVDDHRWLVRLDGDGWPCCQRDDLPDTQPDTWSVALHYGTAPPNPLGKMAAVELGYQLALAFNPATADRCNLPTRVTSAARAGQTNTLQDPNALLDFSQLGLYICDRLVKFSNPRRVDRPARVLSPDFRPHIRRTGT